MFKAGHPTVFRAKISDEREVRRWRFVKLLTSPYRLLLLSLKNVRTARVACSPMKAARIFTSCSAPPGRGRTRQLIQQSGRQRTSKATRANKGRPGIVHTSLYLLEALYEALREAAFRERCKIHDIVLEGIELALRKRGRRS